MQIINCQGGKYFGNKVCAALGLEAIESDLHIFENGELLLSLGRAEGETYIVQSFERDSNNRLMELMLCIDAARRSGATKIHAIIPYLCYSRFDRALLSGGSFGLEVIAGMLNHSGLSSITTIDIHSPDSLRIFKIPVRNIPITNILLKDHRTVIAPDFGAQKRLESYAKDLIAFEKRRDGDDLYMKLLGDVRGKECLIVDDIIDSGRTMSMAASILMASGAKSVDAYATHAFLTRATSQILSNAPIRHLMTSDIIENKKLHKKFTLLDLGPIVAKLLV
jgi:ribose-phosphate pyrophosphokinase